MHPHLLGHQVVKVGVMDFHPARCTGWKSITRVLPLIPWHCQFRGNGSHSIHPVGEVHVLAGVGCAHREAAAIGMVDDVDLECVITCCWEAVDIVFPVDRAPQRFVGPVVGIIAGARK